MPSIFRGDLLRDEAWRSHDFRGQRVAVVASAEETARIVPHVVRAAAGLKVFQRSPTWVLPTRVPLPAGPIRRRAARLHLRMAVRDQWLRRQLTPFGDQPGVVVRPGFYAALQQPNCKLYTWPVYAIAEHGIRSAEGVEHRVDVIVLGTDVEIDDRALREERTA